MSGIIINLIVSVMVGFIAWRILAVIEYAIHMSHEREMLKLQTKADEAAHKHWLESQPQNVPLAILQKYDAKGRLEEPPFSD